MISTFGIKYRNIKNVAPEGVTLLMLYSFVVDVRLVGVGIIRHGFLC